MGIHKKILEIVSTEIQDSKKLYNGIPLAEVVYLHLNENLADGESKFIHEAKRSYLPIPGTKYTYRIDRPFGESRPGNQPHIHVFSKGKEIFAMNIDGTAHDGYHQVIIPDDVADFLRKKGFTIPPGNLIEVLTYYPGLELLLD